MNPTWIPSKEIIESSNIYKMMQQLGIANYQDFWNWSVTEKNSFWEKTVEKLGIVFEKKYNSIVNVSAGVEEAIWLYGAQFNIVDACFQNKENATVIISENKKGELEKTSQKELEILVNKTANGMVFLGLKPKDTIAIYMPMTIEAIVVYLAAIKAGFSVATIADSFSVEEISTRIEMTNPQLIFTQDGFLRGGKTHFLYEKCNHFKVSKIIVVQRLEEKITLQTNASFFDEFLSANEKFISVKGNSTDITTLLFSSGTTGKPKAIPWDQTTPIKSASDAYYHHNIQQNDVLCWPTNLGWMMGPWLVFASLINKASIALYEGSPLDKGFGKFVEEAKVTMLGVVPSIVKNWKETAQMESFNWNTIKCFSSTGEVSNPTDMAYLMQLGNHKPIIEYCGGTEIGGGYISSTLVQENIPSQFSSQTLGGEFVLLNENGKVFDEGEVFIIPPIMGLSTQLIQQNHYETYYKGTPKLENRTLRKHGDQFIKLENGYYKAQGRVDDAMNLGGIKVSAVQIESVINTLDFVKESAAIAVSPKEGGPSYLVVFYVSKEKKEEENSLKKIQNHVKTKLNPLFKVVDLVKIDTLPRTASNKVKRKELRLQYVLKLEN